MFDFVGGDLGLLHSDSIIGVSEVSERFLSSVFEGRDIHREKPETPGGVGVVTRPFTREAKRRIKQIRASVLMSAGCDFSEGA